MKIKPYDTRIQKLFQSAFYKIPRFQRPYSWDKGNIEDFWSDIILPGGTQHFIGSMVLYEGAGSDLYVVDGQQRLTTITIFLAALRDTFQAIGEDGLAKGIQGVIERQDISAKNRFVLLTETSYPYFQEYVQKHGAPDIKITPTEEEKGIQTAYNFAKSGFLGLIEEAKSKKKSVTGQKAAVKERLETCRDALLSLNIIIIQLDNEDDAYVVFETLNTRGRDLEPKDLIKNLLTKFLPARSSDVDSTKIIWDSIVNTISKSSAGIDMSTYIHHWWLSKHEYTPEKTLFNSFKRTVKKANAKDYLDGLKRDVDIYRRMFEPNAFEWKNEETPIRRSLAALNLFKVRQPAPLLLSILRSYYAKQISLKQAREALASIERFHFMYTAVAGQSSSGGVSKMYAASSRTLSQEDDEQKRARILQEFKGKLKDRLPERRAFTAGFNELEYTQSDSRDRPLIKYIFSIIDSNLRGDAVVDYEKMTIEHIAPQSPPAGVAQVTGYGLIGNLVLVSESLNGKLKNKPFSEKKKILSKAGLPMDDTLKTSLAWSDAEISNRSEKLIDIFYRK